MSNKLLYDLAISAINKLFSDKSVSQGKAKENLEGLRDELDILIDSLEGE